jgi:hypothetical protein
VSRQVRLALLTVSLLLVAAGVIVVVLALASRRVPAFYRAALEVDPAAQRAAGDRMVKQIAALAGDVQKQGRWQAVFTEEEINGYLAAELFAQHPELLPARVSDPRVRIEPESLAVAFRYRDPSWEGVVWLAVDLYPVEPNVVALRIRKVRAGALPLPLENVLDQIAQATDRLDWQVAWRQADGDPVAQVTIPPLGTRGKRIVQVEVLRLEQGRIVMAGTTRGR